MYIIADNTNYIEMQLLKLKKPNLWYGNMCFFN